MLLQCLSLDAITITCMKIIVYIVTAKVDIYETPYSTNVKNIQGRKLDYFRSNIVFIKCLHL